MPYTLSPSALGLMEECPRCFWLNHHDVWKRPAGIFSSLPSGMDRILKRHFDRFIHELSLPPELCESELCRGLRLFDDEELLKEWRNNFKGVSLTDDDGNVLRGAVDNILKNGDRLVVLDYKTRGYPLKEDSAEYYRLQMDTYNFLLRKNGYETEDYALILFYYPKEVAKTGEFIFDTELVKVEVNDKRAYDAWRLALDLLDGDCPEKRCEWCEKV